MNVQEGQGQGQGDCASEILVKQFRQILVWPLQLTPQEGKITATAYWERLLSLDSAWQEVVHDDAQSSVDLRERRYAEFVAFTPDVQHFLYGEGQSAHGAKAQSSRPIRTFRRRDVATVDLVLRRGEPTLTLNVERIELYFFYDVDLAVLAVEIDGRDMSLEQAQEIMFRFGRAYPNAWDADGNGSCCCASVQLRSPEGTVLAASDYHQKERYLDFASNHLSPRLADHWSFLLQPLMPHHGSDNGPILYRQLEHHRIPMLAYLAVDDPYRIGRDDWMRLGLAARPGPKGLAPFAAGFLEGFEARYCYDRFWDGRRGHDQTATRMICSGRAFIMVGEANNPHFINEETGILAQFRHQYFLLGLIAHFHKAALLIVRDRLASAMSQLQNYSATTVKRFKRESRLCHVNFLRFTHRYWFQEVSNQRPAQDLFRLWTKHLGTERLFVDVREEVLDMISYLDSDGLRKQANTVVRLTVVTFFGLIGTLATGFLGMNLIDLTQVSLLQKSLYFVAALVPMTVFTFYIAAKSQRLAEFVDTMSDERQSLRVKWRAFVHVWERGR